MNPKSEQTEEEQLELLCYGVRNEIRFSKTPKDFFLNCLYKNEFNYEEIIKHVLKIISSSEINDFDKETAILAFSAILGKNNYLQQERFGKIGQYITQYITQSRIKAIVTRLYLDIKNLEESLNDLSIKEQKRILFILTQICIDNYIYLEQFYKIFQYPKIAEKLMMAYCHSGKFEKACELYNKYKLYILWSSNFFPLLESTEGNYIDCKKVIHNMINCSPDGKEEIFKVLILYQDLFEQFGELKKENEELKIRIYYAPGEDGMKESEISFENALQGMKKLESKNIIRRITGNELK